jgi:hypothetical protein
VTQCQHDSLTGRTMMLIAARLLHMTSRRYRSDCAWHSHMNTQLKAQHCSTCSKCQTTAVLGVGKGKMSVSCQGDATDGPLSLLQHRTADTPVSPPNVILTCNPVGLASTIPT